MKTVAAGAIAPSSGEPPTPELVLASTSPRRVMLLGEHGYRFRVAPVPVAESAAGWLSVRELVMLNAGRKCVARAAREPASAVVLGVDTLVSLDGEALGKPADLREAAAMLGRLSGRAHAVYSGVCLMQTPMHRAVCFVEETQVMFRGLSAAQIEEYHRLINPLDKAGGYAAQEHGERIIERYEGSWSNVMGLPMETLGEVLAREFSVYPVAG